MMANKGAWERGHSIIINMMKRVRSDEIPQINQRLECEPVSGREYVNFQTPSVSVCSENSFHFIMSQSGKEQPLTHPPKMPMESQATMMT